MVSNYVANMGAVKNFLGFVIVNVQAVLMRVFPREVGGSSSRAQDSAFGGWDD